ncbi:AN1-type zinc finger protein 2A-like isoform X2 [Tubulanus polymorphus]|uniref:AN1-type zinc finger protein 2A-like isoform X2 n=1 Tax=Tubulanus polymorphus TaxID=672921 RepID=UPI003DA48CA2
MELPELGQNCHKQSCKQLDFLPFTCDACSKIFCKDHIRYDEHQCSESYKKDNQVPTCPLCNKPIPLKPGELADDKVSQHIDTDCQSDPAKERRGKIYTNKCSYKGCKQKELIPVSCEKCNKNYCLRHRHEQDHYCTGYRGSTISQAGVAALHRIQNAVPNSKPFPKLQQTKAKSGKQLNGTGRFGSSPSISCK